MSSRRPVAILAAAAACAGGAAPHAERPLLEMNLVDLTHPFEEATVYWPTEPGFALETVFEGTTERGYFYAANRFRAAEHGGTHVDAPYHFHADGQTVDEIPLRRLVAPGVVVDVSAPAARDPDHLVTVDELSAWEEEHGEIPRGAIVLVSTGFAERWPDREAYMGTAERGPDAAARLHFPGLSAEAARFLAVERGVGAVGIDTPSIDHGPSRTFDAHVALFEHDVPAFENVAALGALPPRGFLVVALPMKIAGGSGAPLRIVAIVDEPAS